MSNKDSGRGQNAFEERLAKLEKTVETLSSEEITLEEAVRQSEQGLNDYEACKKILEEARQKIETYQREDDEEDRDA